MGIDPTGLEIIIPDIEINENHVYPMTVLGLDDEDDPYGHHWIEFDNESYGWWPYSPVGLWSTAFGTSGCLNGVPNFGGSATTDPHHGDDPDTEHSACLKVIDEVESDDILINISVLQYGPKSGTKCGNLVKAGKLKPGAADSIKACIRSAAVAFDTIHDSWSYGCGGPSCHEMLDFILDRCCMKRCTK